MKSGKAVRRFTRARGGHVPNGVRTLLGARPLHPALEEFLKELGTLAGDAVLAGDRQAHTETMEEMAMRRRVGGTQGGHGQKRRQLTLFERTGRTQSRASGDAEAKQGLEHAGDGGETRRGTGSPAGRIASTSSGRGAKT